MRKGFDGASFRLYCQGLEAGTFEVVASDGPCVESVATVCPRTMPAQ